MAKTKIRQRLPWENRWAEPTQEQLGEPMNPDRRKIFDAMIENFASFEGVEQKLVWHGTDWKWTYEFTLEDQSGLDLGTVAYIVPKPDTAIICIPLTDDQLATMPFKRLNKYIREGIRSAKQAVSLHWGLWTPTANTEVEYLTDLFKRKYKALLAGAGKA